MADMVSIVLTAHKDREELMTALRSAQLQTWPGREVIALACCIPGLERMSQQGEQPELQLVECQEDFGHAKRAQGLELARGDWVMFWAADDLYHVDFLRTMVLAGRASGADLVACDWIPKWRGSMMKTQPRTGQVTSGNFIVRRSVALHAGYRHRHYEADGAFIEDVMATGATWHRVKAHPDTGQPLYIHR